MKEQERRVVEALTLAAAEAGEGAISVRSRWEGYIEVWARPILTTYEAERKSANGQDSAYALYRHMSGGGSIFLGSHDAVELPDAIMADFWNLAFWLVGPDAWNDEDEEDWGDPWDDEDEEDWE